MSDGIFYRLNYIRNRIPYAYWLLYDVVIGWLLWWGYTQLSHLFAIGLAFLAVAVFFDVVESVIKWRWKHGEFRQAAEHTGIAASWCPICGNCTCPRWPDGERKEADGDPACPLHGMASLHG